MSGSGFRALGVGLSLGAAYACGGIAETDGGGGAAAGSGAMGGAVAGAGGVSGGGAEGGSSAVSGSAGVGAQGGAAGSFPGGTAGSFVTGGTAGSLATGGSGGVSEPECVTDEECLLVNSCCECAGHAVAVPVERCEIDTCAVSTCEARNIPAAGALCRAGRCVLDVSCNDSTVECAATPPVCPAGEKPAVLDTCWTGGCVPVTECSSVYNCSYCSADQGCAVYVTQEGFTVSHCTTPASGCQSDRTCGCYGLSVCPAPFECNASNPKGVLCTCPQGVLCTCPAC